MIVDIAISIFLFIFGASLSSFISVVGFRGSWKKAIFGKSYCDNCKKRLSAVELVTIFSFLIQRGKCRECNYRIPKEYFIGELLTGFFFVVSYFFLDNPLYSIEMMIVALFLIPIILEDIKTHIVPEALSIPFVVIAFSLSLFYSITEETYLPLLYGIALASPFFLIWLLSKGRAMGLADSKIALSLGFLSHSFLDVVSTFLYSFWFGAMIVLIYMLFKYLRTGDFQLTRKSKIAFIPFLGLSYGLVAFFSLDIYQLLSKMVY